MQVGLCGTEVTGTACAHPSVVRQLNSEVRKLQRHLRDLWGQESSWRLQSPRSLVWDRGQHLVLSCHWRLFDNSAVAEWISTPRTIPLKFRAVPGPAQFVLTPCTGGTGQDLCEGSGAAAQTTTPKFWGRKLHGMSCCAQRANPCLQQANQDSQQC